MEALMSIGEKSRDNMNSLYAMVSSFVTEEMLTEGEGEEAEV
jgi:hypothetical protein